MHPLLHTMTSRQTALLVFAEPDKEKDDDDDDDDDEDFELSRYNQVTQAAVPNSGAWCMPLEVITRKTAIFVLRTL